MRVGSEALRDAVDEILLPRIASDVGERQDDDREPWRGRIFRCQGRRGFAGWRVDLERIDPD